MAPPRVAARGSPLQSPEGRGLEVQQRGALVAARGQGEERATRPVTPCVDACVRLCHGRLHLFLCLRFALRRSLVLSRAFPLPYDISKGARVSKQTRFSAFAPSTAPRSDADVAIERLPSEKTPSALQRAGLRRPVSTLFKTRLDALRTPSKRRFDALQDALQ